ncbi:MAG TPA: alpha/beta hydrolase [Pseudoxanthomonas sp.]|nr:alpha/beta hydrolase [Pseudoxanthomonas sp.]
MTRSFPLRGLIAVAAALLAAGCQSVAFGIANRGVSAADASAIYDTQHGLALDIYRPDSSTKTPMPVVVFFYGGGWKTGKREQYRFVGKRLAQQGVLAIVADYRTWPRTTFPGFVEDGARAVAWSRDHAADYGGDPKRLYVAGHSAGAQIAALIGTDSRYLSANGMKPRDLAGVIGLSGPYDFVINGGYEEVFGPTAQWPQAQAVNLVDGDEPPFLLIHGTGDQVVEAKDSQELADKLRATGGKAQLVWLPDAGHIAPLAALYEPKRDPVVIEAMRAFIR